MSELMNNPSSQADFRRHLLASVSAASVMVISSYSSSAALADDQDRPTVWIEVGGQLEGMSGRQEPFAPAFVAILPNTFFSPLSIQKPLQNSVGGEGRVTFEPAGSDWLMSASVRFGRSAGSRQKHQQTPNGKFLVNVTVAGQKLKYGSYYPYRHVKFNDAAVKQSESHVILDFQAGKDVGLGMFGSKGSSVFSAGVRFAQFESKSAVDLHNEPDVHYPSAPINSKYELNKFESAPIHFHDYAAMSNNQRSFHGAGPFVAWNASLPFVGSQDRGEITLDWGANAAILFGRQKASGHHQTATQTYYDNKWKRAGNGLSVTAPGIKSGYFVNQALPYVNGNPSVGPVAHRSNAANFNRIRTVAVPDLGGFAGFSFLYSNAKVSFGYRADFFFGAMDSGIDSRKTENVGFHGPFATISIGLP